MQTLKVEILTKMAIGFTRRKLHLSLAWAG
ncbi:hypothetical protein BRC2024_HCTLARHO_CDS_0047 [Acinetobacter phage vB_AbaS_Silvergun]